MKFVNHHVQGNAAMASSIPTALKALAAVSLLPLLAACQDQAISAIAKSERPVQVQQVAFRTDNASREFVGVVRARQADPSTRTYAARFTIEQPDDSVVLGMTAILTLSHPAPAVAKLPLAAVLDRGTGPSVYVVDKAGMLELRPVEVASFTGDTALLTAGVHGGERVVTLGVQKLGAGQKVRVVEAH
jgi:hypothetical protein